MKVPRGDIERLGLMGNLKGMRRLGDLQLQKILKSEERDEQ